MDWKWKTVVKLEERQPSGRKRRTTKCRTFFPNKSYCFKPDKNRANGTGMKITNIPSRCDTLSQFRPKKPKTRPCEFLHTLRPASHPPSVLHTHDTPSDARCFQGVAPMAVGSVSDCGQRRASIVTLLFRNKQGRKL